MTRALALAEMPEIDHRISQAIHGIVQRTDTFEAQQQAPKLILPAKHSRG